MNNISQKDPIAIVPIECLKRALLLFPRVAYPGFRYINLEFFGDNWLEAERERVSNSSDEREQEYLRELESLYTNHSDWHPHYLINCAYVRSLANSYVIKGEPFVYLYDDKLPGVVQRGQEISYCAALRGLDIVDEAQITMEQVEEFRNDPEATRKYRALRLWLHEGIRAKSISHANDIVVQKLEDYSWAIEKHGLATITGAIESIIDSKHVAALAGGAGTTALLAGPIWASIAGGLIVGASVSTWIAKQKMKLEEIKRGNNSEVAIIYDARKAFAKDG